MPAMQPKFVHLRLHSEYSIVDGIARIDDAVAAAAADGMPALALTDLSNVFGMVKFYQAARGKGLKPVIGCDVWITNETDRDKPHRALFLCASRAGYLRLCDWLTRAYRSNQHRGRAEIRKEWLRESGTDGLIALSGAHLGDIGHALLADNAEQAKKHVAVLGRVVSAALLHRVAASRPAERGALRQACRAPGIRAETAGRGDASGAVPEARGLRRSRGPGLHCRGLRAVRPAPAAPFHRGAIPQEPGGDGRVCLPICRRHWKTRSRSRAAATSRSNSASRGCRCSRRPTA